MRKKPGITHEDRLLFRANMKGVRPIKSNKIPQIQPPQPIAKPPQHMKIYSDILLYNANEYQVSGEDTIFFAHAGLQTRVIKQLRSGHFTIRGKLDLHGLHVDAAKQALLIFLDQACAKHLRYVLIIHGKGSRTDSRQAILKNQVNTWLRQHPAVLAFCSAKNYAGGTGAVYVLLKTKFYA